MESMADTTVANVIRIELSYVVILNICDNNTKCIGIDTSSIRRYSMI